MRLSETENSSLQYRKMSIQLGATVRCRSRRHSRRSWQASGGSAKFIDLSEYEGRAAVTPQPPCAPALMSMAVLARVFNCSTAV
jgi:hypothetical protein